MTPTPWHSCFPAASSCNRGMMDIVKKLFPLSFRPNPEDSNTLAGSIVLYVVIIVAYFLVSAVLGYLLGTLAAWLLGLLGITVGLYCTGGVVICVLRYSGILK